MQKVLTQEEIDALIQTARSGGQATEQKVKAPVVTVWDAHLTNQIGREQMQSVSALHDSFARNLTHSLGAYLRSAFSAALVSAERLNYKEFLQRVPEKTYMATVRLAPVGATALLQMDLAVVFALIDVLMGGEGKGPPPERQVTEIEEQILETVMSTICRELQSAWQALSLEFQFERRQQPAEVQGLMASEDKTLALSFEITLLEIRGTLNLMVPAVVSNALLRKLAAMWTRAKPQVRMDSGQSMQERVLDCPFRMELGITAAKVPLRELMGLSPGSVLVLQRPADEPAVLSVSGRAMFNAIVARRGLVLAAQIVERRPEAKPERRKASDRDRSPQFHARPGNKRISSSLGR